jgi:hypothetical protein
MFSYGRIRWTHAQAARHAQVDDDGAIVEPEQNILPPTVHSLDALSFYFFAQLSRYRPTQCAISYDQIADDMMMNVWFDTTPRGLDLG